MKNSETGERLHLLPVPRSSSQSSFSGSSILIVSTISSATQDKIYSLLELPLFGGVGAGGGDEGLELLGPLGLFSPFCTPSQGVA